jgi:hypothetical protein
MTLERLVEILEKHKLWLNGKDGGKYANLSGINLRYANLSGANLSDTNLRYANLSDANLSDANLIGANLSGANLSDANLSGINLSGINLSGINLSGISLSGTNFRDADLSGANLSDANLSDANLIGANLSGAKGLLSAVNFMETNFERTAEGYLAYKTFGHQYKAPLGWKIEKGSVISENVNACRVDSCGSGINVAPLAWVKSHYRGEIWKVLIRWQWQSGVCVPYNTDGKIRCERVELIEKVEK